MVSFLYCLLFLIFPAEFGGSHAQSVLELSVEVRGIGIANQLRYLVDGVFRLFQELSCLVQTAGDYILGYAYPEGLGIEVLEP